MENRKNIFIEKNLKRLSSPEELNEYLKVVNPSKWIVLFSIFLILSGMFVWCIVGTVESRINIDAEVFGNTAHFKSEKMLKSGMPVTIGDTESTIRDIGIDKDGNYIGAASVPEMTDGIYKASVVIERVNPIYLLFN